MDTLDEKQIERSKTKMVRVLFIAAGFAALGVWLLSMSATEIEDHLHRDPTYVHVIGLLGVLFSAFCGIVIFRKLFQQGPGLILNSSGIFCSPGTATDGFIPWTDISGAEIYELRGTKLLVIKLKDPRKYIERGSSFRQTMAKASYELSGSPIAIGSGILKISFAELLSTFNQYHQKYGRP